MLDKNVSQVVHEGQKRERERERDKARPQQAVVEAGPAARLSHAAPSTPAAALRFLSTSFSSPLSPLRPSSLLSALCPQHPLKKTQYYSKSKAQLSLPKDCPNSRFVLSALYSPRLRLDTQTQPRRLTIARSPLIRLQELLPSPATTRD